MDAQRRLRATAPKTNFPLKVDRNKSGICTSSLLILYYSFTPMQTLVRYIGKSWYCLCTVQGDKCRTVQSVVLMLPHTLRNHQLTSSIPSASSPDRPPDQLEVVLIIDSQDFCHDSHFQHINFGNNIPSIMAQNNLDSHPPPSPTTTTHTLHFPK